MILASNQSKANNPSWVRSAPLTGSPQSGVIYPKAVFLPIEKWKMQYWAYMGRHVPTTDSIQINRAMKDQALKLFLLKDTMCSIYIWNIVFNSFYPYFFLFTVSAFMCLAMLPPCVYYRPWQPYQFCFPSAVGIGINLPGPVEQRVPLKALCKGCCHWITSYGLDLSPLNCSESRIGPQMR